MKQPGLILVHCIQYIHLLLFINVPCLLSQFISLCLPYLLQLFDLNILLFNYTILILAFVILTCSSSSMSLVFCLSSLVCACPVCSSCLYLNILLFNYILLMLAFVIQITHLRKREKKAIKKISAS